MCNAWNHAIGCNCGWGEGWSLGGPETDYVALLAGYQAGRKPGVSIVGGVACWSDPIEFCRPTICAYCGAFVYFVRHNGGSAWFDELGYPWPKHDCYYEAPDGKSHARNSSNARPAPTSTKEDERVPSWPNVDGFIQLASARPNSRLAIVVRAITTPFGRGLVTVGLPGANWRTAVVSSRLPATALAGKLVLLEAGTFRGVLVPNEPNEPVVGIAVLPVGGLGWPCFDGRGSGARVPDIVHRIPNGFGILVGANANPGASASIAVLFTDGSKVCISSGLNRLRYLPRGNVP